MKVVIDGLGGDFAPEEIVRGVIEARKTGGPEIIITGPENILEKEFSEAGGMPAGVEIHNTSQKVEMDEPPSKVIKEKKDSSLVVGARLVKEGKGQAFISAGNTGAVMASGIFIIGRLKGIDRPGIATPIPGEKKMSLLIDAGANADCKANHMLHFAYMGKLYMEKVLARKDPKIALLNVGHEAQKGSKLYQEAYSLLKTGDLNFVGNLEGRELFSEQCDVLVCDGFVGNITLKVTEGVAQTIITMLKNEVGRSVKAKAGALLMKGALKSMKNRMDYEEFGGAPLLGLQSPVVICHGSSKAKAIKNAIFVGAEIVEKKVIEGLGQLL